MLTGTPDGDDTTDSVAPLRWLRAATGWSLPCLYSACGSGSWDSLICRRDLPARAQSCD